MIRAILSLTICAALVAVLASMILSGGEIRQPRAAPVPPTSVVKAFVKTLAPKANSFRLHSAKIRKACTSGCVYRVWGDYSTGAVDRLDACHVDPAGTRVKGVVLQRYADSCWGRVIFGQLKGRLSSVTNPQIVKAWIKARRPASHNFVLWSKPGGYVFGHYVRGNGHRCDLWRWYVRVRDGRVARYGDDCLLFKDG